MIVSKRAALSIAAGVATLSLAACGSTGASGYGSGGSGGSDSGSGTGGSSGQSATVPSQLSAVSIDSFLLTQGEPGWAAGEEREVAGSSWSFDPSGQFEWVTSDTGDFASDLLPVTGSYTVSGNTITFQGQSSRTTTNSSTTVVVAGTVQPQGNGYVVSMRMSAGNGMWANVDNQQFSGDATSSNQSVVEATAS